MKSHFAAFAAALLLSAPSAALAQAGSKGTVRVGVLLPLTGNTAWAGKTNRIAATIAAEEVNAQDLAGGYKVELVFGEAQKVERWSCQPFGGTEPGSSPSVTLLIPVWPRTVTSTVLVCVAVGVPVQSKTPTRVSAVGLPTCSGTPTG